MENDVMKIGGKSGPITDAQILSRVRDDLDTLGPIVNNKPPKKAGRPRQEITKQPRKHLRHSIKNCKFCALPRAVKLRAEEDFVNWHSTRQITDDLIAKGYVDLRQSTVYNHCVALGLDNKRGVTMERGIARLANDGMNQIELGMVKWRAADLVAVLTLWAKLNGKLTDNQTINSILIRNNIPTLEDIANIKDKNQLDERAAQILRELQEAGALPGMSPEQVHYNRVRELVREKIDKDA